MCIITTKSCFICLSVIDSVQAFSLEMIYHLHFLDIAFSSHLFWSFILWNFSFNLLYFMKSFYISDTKFFWWYSNIFPFSVAFPLIFIWLLFIVPKSLALWIATHPSCSWWYPPFLIFVNWFPSRTEINILSHFLLDNFLWVRFYVYLWFIWSLWRAVFKSLAFDVKHIWVQILSFHFTSRDLRKTSFFLSEDVFVDYFTILLFLS